MFSIRITAAGTVRSKLSEPGRVAESMLAKISLVIWASNKGWIESRPETKVGISEELAMASIFSACKEDVDAELVVGRATMHGKRRAGSSFLIPNFGAAELFANRSSRRWKWKRS